VSLKPSVTWYSENGLHGQLIFFLVVGANAHRLPKAAGLQHHLDYDLPLVVVATGEDGELGATDVRGVQWSGRAPGHARLYAHAPLAQPCPEQYQPLTAAQPWL
jgi:hypothetical protein